MWLTISFDGRPPLLAAVGMDGDVYFVAQEVAAFLKYSAKYNFALRHARKSLVGVIPDEYSAFLRKSKSLVFKFDEMIEKIHATSNHHHLPIEELQTLVKLWYYGYVPKGIPEPIPFSNRVAHPVTVHADFREGTMPVREWIRDYAKSSLAAYYDKLPVLVAPSSVESNFEGERSVPPFESARMDSGTNQTEEERSRNPIFSIGIVAEKTWNLKSREVFVDVIRTMDSKFEEVQQENKSYELYVKLVQKD